MYRLDLTSELLFVGDAGTTEVSRPSRRVGFELANYYKLGNWLTVDADVAFARARFRDADPTGNRIPVPSRAWRRWPSRWTTSVSSSGAAQLRYFGPRPLLEDNSVRSSSTIVFNARLGYQVSPKMRVELEGFNLANRRASAIDYYYTSRLRARLLPAWMRFTFIRSSRVHSG
ncbi:MAG: TonB-dependent receptor [Burkholderiales bacterium]